MLVKSRREHHKLTAGYIDNLCRVRLLEILDSVQISAPTLTNRGGDPLLDEARQKIERKGRRSGIIAIFLRDNCLGKAVLRGLCCRKPAQLLCRMRNRCRSGVDAHLWIACH